MSIFSGYFNSVGGDRKYNAETMSKYYSGIISRGVLQNWLNEFAVIAQGSMVVGVSPGRAYFTDGKWVENTATYNLTLDAADVTLSRIDRIVLREDKNENARTVSIVIKKGTPGVVPTAPTLISTDYVEEISLASVYVARLTEIITQANITDERPMNDVCGFVHGLINQIDTQTLFLQYDSVFNTWFQSVKETLSTTTLIRQYNSHYTTISENQTIIPINISQYNSALDILNVFINGLKLIRGVDYLQTENDNTQITLLAGLDIGQMVDFEVFKSVDGSEAETVVQQVYDLQQSVNTLDEYIYYTTGENDNLKLSNLCQEYFIAVDAPDQMTIEIVGNNFSATTPAQGEGTSANRYKWFNVGLTGGSTRRLTLDFGKCSKITIANALANTLIFLGRNVTIRNLELKVTAGTNVTCTENLLSEYYNCDIELTGSGVMCFARCCGVFENNKIRVVSTNDNAFCFEGTGVNFQRITGGTYYAYTGVQNKVAAPFYAPSGESENILLMTNCNCPFEAVANYYQSECVKINSGKYALFGNIVSKAPSIAAGANGTEQGTIIADIVI